MNGQPERPDDAAGETPAEPAAEQEGRQAADGDAASRDALSELQAKADENWDRCLEMGIAAADTADAAALLAGSEATLKQFTAVLERFGIAEIDPLGEPFDPDYHEAMTMQPSAKAEPGSVLTVVQKGYTLNGRLLRPARVIVAADSGNAPADG
jgi:molecular chaperone GrpE